MLEASSTTGNTTTTTKDPTVHSVIKHPLCSKARQPDNMFYLSQLDNLAGGRSPHAIIIGQTRRGGQVDEMHLLSRTNSG